MIFDGGRVKTQDESSREQKEEPLPHQKKNKTKKIHQTHFCQRKQRKSKTQKKTKKSCSMHKNLSSSSKNSLSLCAAQIEKNGPLLRGAKRGEEQQHDEQQQKRSDQRTLRITLKPRPEASRREIRVRGFEQHE